VLGFLVELGEYLITNYGYFGVVIVSFISSSTLFLPIPISSHLTVFAFSTLLNPYLVGLSAGIGTTLGELTGYAAGYGGQKLVKLREKYTKKLSRLEDLFNKYGFWLIIVFAATPLPDDLLGIFCGSIKYDLKRFIVSVFIGKTIMFTLIALFGNSLTWLLF